MLVSYIFIILGVNISFAQNNESIWMNNRVNSTFDNPIYLKHNSLNKYSKDIDSDLNFDYQRRDNLYDFDYNLFRNTTSLYYTKLQFNNIDFSFYKRGITMMDFHPTNYNAILGMNLGASINYSSAQSEFSLNFSSIFNRNTTDFRIELSSMFRITDKLYFMVYGGTPLYSNKKRIGVDPYLDLVYWNRNSAYIGANLIYLLNDKWKIYSGYRLEYDIITKQRYIRPELGISIR
jgi:hypothetical protein